MPDQVFLLYHIRPEGQLLLIGAYSSEDRAKEAIERLKNKPGFNLYPDCFEYHSYDLNVDQWADGFAEGEEDDDPSEEPAPLPN